MGDEVPLKEYFEKLLAEKDSRDQQRYEAQQIGLNVALTAQEKAVNAALLAAERAVNKAEIAAEKRFDAVNEFRGQLSDQAATFMPRIEAEQRIGQNAEKVDDLTARMNSALASMGSRLDLTQGRSTGLSDGFKFLLGALMLLPVVTAVVAYALAHH